jgi:hypothetical protein
VVIRLVLWHVDPLLGNDREISNGTTAISMYGHRKQARLHCNRNGVFCSVRVEVLQAGQVMSEPVGE